MCLCSEINRLREFRANGEDSSQPALTHSTEFCLAVHLETLCWLLSSSKRLSKDLPFSIKPKSTAETVLHDRTGAIFRQKFDSEVAREVFEKFKTNLWEFWCLEKGDWLPANEQQTVLLEDFVYSTLNVYIRLGQAEAHQALVRRLNSIVIYLLSKVLPARYNPKLIASSFHNVSLFNDLSEEELQRRISQFCDAGNRYVNIARQLGGIGAIWCLPLEVARTA